MIKIGSTSLKSDGGIYVGSIKIRAAYIGSDLVYQISSSGPSILTLNVDCSDSYYSGTYTWDTTLNAWQKDDGPPGMRIEYDSAGHYWRIIDLNGGGFYFDEVSGNVNAIIGTNTWTNVEEYQPDATITISEYSSSTPTITLSQNTATVSGTTGTAITSLDISSYVTTTPSDLAVTYSASGLPTGLSLSNAGVLSGTPTATSSASINVTLSATGAASQTFTLVFNIVEASHNYVWTVSNSSEPTANGDYWDTGISSMGNSTYTNGYCTLWFSPGILTYELYKGVVTDDTGTGLDLLIGDAISGGTSTPEGTYSDGSEVVPYGYATVTINVVSATVNVAGTVNTAITQVDLNNNIQVTPIGSEVLFSANGLPTGLSLSNNGILSGTPTVTSADNVTVLVQDASDLVNSVTFTIAFAIESAAPSHQYVYMVTEAGDENARGGYWLDDDTGLYPIYMNDNGYIMLYDFNGIEESWQIRASEELGFEDRYLGPTDSTSPIGTWTSNAGALPVPVVSLYNAQPTPVYSITGVTEAAANGDYYPCDSSNMPTNFNPAYTNGSWYLVSLDNDFDVQPPNTADFLLMSNPTYGLMTAEYSKTGRTPLTSDNPWYANMGAGPGESIIVTLYGAAVTPEITVITASTNVSGTVGTAITSVDLSSNVSVTPSGTELTFSASNLPSGLSLSSAGVLSGTPSASASNTVTVTVSATGATSQTLTLVFDIADVVSGNTYVVSGAGDSAFDGVYTRGEDQYYAGIGTVEVYWNESNLIALWGSDEYGWNLEETYGNPNVNSNPPAYASDTPTITGPWTTVAGIGDPPTVTSGSTPVVTPTITLSQSTATVSGTTGTAITNLDISQYVTTTPSDLAVTYSASGLPTGLTLSNAGVLSGTPTATSSSSVAVTLSATGATSQTFTLNFSITAASSGNYTVTGDISSINGVYSPTGNTLNGAPIYYSSTASMYLYAYRWEEGYGWAFSSATPEEEYEYYPNPGAAASNNVAEAACGGSTLTTPDTIASDAWFDNSYIPVNVYINSSSGSITPVITIVTASTTVSGEVGTAITSVNLANMVSVSPSDTELTFSASGLPTGLSLSSAGVLSGTPSSTSSSSVTVTVSATNAQSVSLTILFDIDEAQQPVAPTIIARDTTVSGTVGTALSVDLSNYVTVTNADTVIYSTNDTLPSGLSLSTAGVLSGTPAAASLDTIHIGIEAENSYDVAYSSMMVDFNIASVPLSFSVSSPVVVNKSTGQNINIDLHNYITTNATSITFDDGNVGGNWPSGLSFNNNTGVLSGSVSEATSGSYTIVVAVTKGEEYEDDLIQINLTVTAASGVDAETQTHLANVYGTYPTVSYDTSTEEIATLNALIYEDEI